MIVAMHKAFFLLCSLLSDCSNLFGWFCHICLVFCCCCIFHFFVSSDLLHFFCCENGSCTSQGIFCRTSNKCDESDWRDIVQDNNNNHCLVFVQAAIVFKFFVCVGAWIPPIFSSSSILLLYCSIWQPAIVFSSSALVHLLCSTEICHLCPCLFPFFTTFALCWHLLSSQNVFLSKLCRHLQWTSVLSVVCTSNNEDLQLIKSWSDWLMDELLKRKCGSPIGKGGQVKGTMASKIHKYVHMQIGKEVSGDSQSVAHLLFIY